MSLNTRPLNTRDVDIAIITSREDELKAVRERFQTERYRVPRGRTYLLSQVKTPIEF